MFQPTQFGKYYLYERIAVGGMAEIFKGSLYGTDGFEKKMVVKQILPQFAKSREFIQMFIDEAKICVSLSHGNIVPVYELGQINGIYFISMEYIDGVTLGELLDAALDADKPVSIPHALFICMEMLSGLDYAHRKTDEQNNPLNIVHRDVSPQNILISFEGEVKLVDFGIARAATKVHATEAGVIKGKFGYMSPEQAAGKKLDARSDVFAAGILLYEMLTMDRLFDNGEEAYTLDRIKNADIAPPSSINTNLPPELDAILSKALSKNINKRYQSAGEFKLAVSRFLYGLSEEASAKTLSGYIKSILADEIESRRIRQEIQPPPPPQSIQPVSAPQPVPTPQPQPQSAPVTPSPESLFEGSLPSSSQGSAGQAVHPPSLSGGLPDEDLVDNFSYASTGKKLRWIIILGVMALVLMGIVFLKDDITSFFSTVSDVMDESAERLAKKDLGALVIRSRPTSATVYFDNRKVGKTNMRIGSIDTSRDYELVLTKKGYPPWSRSITVSDWKQGKEKVITVYKDWTADSLK
jgi:serine/threonine protein kinase